MEKKISSEIIYEGKILTLTKDKVLVDDNKAYREIVHHNGGACIALKKDDKYFLVKQYRYAHQMELFEFPAGKIENGELPLQAIKREAIEETGYSAKNIKSLGYVIPTCGYSSEKIHLFVGEVDEYLGQHLDVDERLNLYEFSFKEIEEMIKDNKIVDSKTIDLVLKIKLGELDG